MTKVAHWCCGRCGKAVVPVGAKGVQAKMLAHRKRCGPLVGFLIKQVPQGATR